MAFEVMLLPTNRVAVIGTRRNPFTGEEVAGGQEAMMTDVERDSVRAFLARHGAVLTDDLNVRLPNASISSPSLDPGGALVALRGDITVCPQPRATACCPTTIMRKTKSSSSRAAPKSRAT